jgi:RND superfamily putative drug exporter
VRAIARFSARHPLPVLAVWAVAFVVAVAFASSARDHLHQTDLQIPGTESTRAAQLTRDQFGSTLSSVVLLKGPSALVEQRGPGIVRALEQIKGVEVLSPWTATGMRVVREPKGQALLTLQVRRTFQQIIDETTPAIERTLARTVPPGMTTEVTGLAPLVRALNDSALHSLDRGELIAVPILLLLLLLIFRSPLAALVPALSGLLVTRIGTGVMGLVSRHVPIDALALNMMTMMGLALGVDYSLLIVSRFREELAAGRGVHDAVEEVAARAGRTVLFAGTALTVGMLGALAMAPGSLLVSSAMGVIAGTVMAVLVALFAMPAGLTLLGANVNRWQFGGARGASPWVAIAERALRRPGAAAFFVLLPLLLLSSPVSALKTGPPNVANLPSDDAARKSFEAFQHDRGSGFSGAFEVDFKVRGPITTTARLRALQDFQTHVSRLHDVASVLGPASLLQRAALLRRVTTQALAVGSPLARLERGLRRADVGTGQLATGLASGASGAGQLVSALQQAGGGSGQLANGVTQATPQTRRLAQGITSASHGSARLTKGLERVLPGVDKLAANLDALQSSLNDQDRTAAGQLIDPLDKAQSSVQAALRELGSASPVAAADPNVARAKKAAADALGQLGTVASNLSGFTTTLDANAVASKQILSGTQRLRRALAQIASGSGKLDAGLAQAASGASQLARGVNQLSLGASALNAGLVALLDGTGGNGGARSLASGLESAASATRQLGGGMQTILANVVSVRQGASRQQSQLRNSGTDVSQAIGSGYFVLAALEGTQRQTQTNIGFATNAANGANVARVIVVPMTGPFDPASIALRGRLQREADRSAHALGAEVVVGGPAVLLDDFNKATSARFPLLVVTLVLVTFLVLLLLFRSPVLALCAVILNLVTVGAAVGVLIICFQGSAPLLGGPGYLDAISLSGIFAVIFGLSIDYEVFLISRMLEGHALTGTTDGAVRYGLEKTATIITGAAFIMAGVFLAFAASAAANIRQFGIGLSVAVLLDATIVRLILLPALIRLFGERTWIVPRWLERILPRFSAH